MFALALDNCRTYPPGVDVVDAHLAEQDLQSGASATAQRGGEDGSVEFLSDVKPLPVDIHWELIQSPFSAVFLRLENDRRAVIVTATRGI